MNRSVSSIVSMSLLGMLTVTSLLAGPVAAHNIAGGGGSLSARQILLRSAKAMAAVTSVHTKGAVKVELTAQAGVPGGGAIVWALFRGDVSGRNYSPSAHIRGQVRLGQPGANPKNAQAKSFKLVVVGQNAGIKLGQQEWVCGSVASLTNLNALIPAGAITHMQHALRYAIGAKTLNMIDPASLLKVGVRKADVVNLGPTRFRGLPVWHLQLKEKQSATVKNQKVAVLLTANLWISQMDYTVRRITASLQGRAGPATVSFSLWDVLSRFNENVPINLPTSCATI